MKFNIGFGTITFALDLAPVTNKAYVQQRIADNKPVSQHDMDKSYDDPNGAHHNATYEKAKALCEGATIVFA